MRRHFCASLVLGAVLASTGCESPAPTQPGAIAPATALEPTQATSAVLSGTLTAPAGIIATGGGNIIAPGGGNIIATGGGNIIAPGGGNIIAPGGGNFAGWGLLAAEDEAVEEKPLAGALIVLTDLAGQPFEGLEPAVTDPSGAFAFDALPVGVPFRLIASVETEGGEPAVLETLAEAGDGADVNAATTLATAQVADGTDAGVGAFDREGFRALVTETRKHLRQSDLPASWGDPQAIKARMAALADRVSELRARLDAVRDRLSEARVSLAELRQTLIERFKQRPAVEPVQHTFYLASALNARAFPVAIELRRPGIQEAVASFTFTSPGERLSVKVVEGQPFAVWSKRRTDFRYHGNGFMRVPRGAQGEVAIHLWPRP